MPELRCVSLEKSNQTFPLPALRWTGCNGCAAHTSVIFMTTCTASSGAFLILDPHNCKRVSLSVRVHLICRHSIAFLLPLWGGLGRGGTQEKQVMWDWRLKYFINQCCSQCVVWWLVENSGNPSFLLPTGIQDSPQVLHVMPLFLYFQGSLMLQIFCACLEGSTLTYFLAIRVS